MSITVIGSAVHERATSLGDPVRTAVPYGGRLTWVLPGGTPLVVHLKDKNKTRHKKRWSQVRSTVRETRCLVGLNSV